MVSLELEARLDNLLSTAQAETADIDLFAPIEEREECPICMIPHSIQEDEIRFMNCCGKRICCGCVYKQTLTDIKKGVPKGEMKCAFCCQLEPKNTIKALKKLMKKNNPEAFMQMSERYRLGSSVLQSDTRSIEMLVRAAELGHAEAYRQIGIKYKDGITVEENTSKAVTFYEVGAKKRSIEAHQNLAAFHSEHHNNNECIKHLKVAASAGYDDAMNNLMNAYKTYKNELQSKEEMDQTLRSYQTSSNEMKSKDRDDARVAMREAGL